MDNLKELKKKLEEARKRLVLAEKEAKELWRRARLVKEEAKGEVDKALGAYLKAKYAIEAEKAQNLVPSCPGEEDEN